MTDIKALPGKQIRRKGQWGPVFGVFDVFAAAGYPGMTLSWWAFNPSTGSDGARYECFTTRDFDQRWEVVPA